MSEQNNIKPEESEGMTVYEVFSQRKQSANFVYQYSLIAPNYEMALVMAKENFMRREPVFNIWVVKKSDIHVLPPEERDMQLIDNKDYRETKGYNYLGSKWRKYKQEMFTEQKLLDHLPANYFKEV